MEFPTLVNLTSSFSFYGFQGSASFVDHFVIKPAFFLRKNGILISYQSPSVCLSVRPSRFL